MKYLKKLHKARRKEQKTRNQYIAAKTHTYKMVEKLHKEYLQEDQARKETRMILEEFALTDEFTEKEAQQTKEEQLSLPLKTREFDENDAAE